MTDSRANSIDFKRAARTLWRRKLWVIFPMLVGLAAGLVATRVIPPTYAASTMVEVEPQKIPADYVKSTVTASMSDRLKTLEQQVTNRENLKTVVLDLGLYPDLVDLGYLEQAANRAKHSMRVGQVRGRIFTVSFESDEPQTAADAANRIAELFVEKNLSLRERQAENASEFLRQELNEVKEELATQEARVLAFKQRNRRYLPDDRDSHLNAINIAERKLDDNRLTRQRLDTEMQLLEQRMRPYPTQGPSAPSHQMTRLIALRDELTRLRTSYTDQHPDVMRLSSEIAALEANLSAAPQARSSSQQVPVDPLLEAQRQAKLNEIAILMSDHDRLLGELDIRQAALERIPIVEQQLSELTRDYETTRRHHDELLKKSQEANLAENLEMRQQSEQFTILERAIAPRSPAKPNREKLMALGLLIGAAAGAGLAFLRQETDQTFADPETLQNAFPAVQVMAAVPRIDVPRAVGNRDGRAGIA